MDLTKQPKAMKREEIEKILTEELGTMYPIEKHIAIIDRLLSLSPVAGYVEVRPEDELPEDNKYKFCIDNQGNLNLLKYDYAVQRWYAKGYRIDWPEHLPKVWLKPVTFPDTQEAKKRYERAISMLQVPYDDSEWLKNIIRIAAGLKEEGGEIN